MYSGNTYKYTVRTSDHNKESGKYITHIYAYDAKGNYSVATTSAQVPDVFALTYDANGGNGAPESVNVIEGNSQILSNKIPQREGYIFTGWNTKQDGSGTTYQPSEFIKLTTNQTIYAQWQKEAGPETPVIHTVSYDANGGNGVPEQQKKETGERLTLSSTCPRREGYTFIGWNTEQDGSGTDYHPGDIYDANADLILYAQWQAEVGSDKPEPSDDNKIGWGDILPEDRPSSGSYPTGLWVAPVPETIKYTGKALTADLHVYFGNARLVEGVDYTVRYKNNKNIYEGPLSGSKAPEAKVLGKGNYNGQAVVKFRIHAGMKQPASYFTAKTTLNSANTGIVLTDDQGRRYSESVTYVKGGVKPKVKVTCNGIQLRCNKDYTVSYQNTLNTGTALVVIKGKGQYAGTVSRAYEIVSKDIGSVKAVVQDKQIKGSKTNARTKVELYDSNGKKLSAGTDYQKDISYYYAQTTELADGTRRMSGDRVVDTDVIISDTKLYAMVAATGGNYSGYKRCEFMVKADLLAKAKVKIPNQTYTGNAVKVNPAGVTVTMNGQKLVYGTDYIIDTSSYVNNVNTGTARVRIQGIGKYEGCSKWASFKITRLTFAGMVIRMFN